MSLHHGASHWLIFLVLHAQVLLHFVFLAGESPCLLLF